MTRFETFCFGVCQQYGPTTSTNSSQYGVQVQRSSSATAATTIETGDVTDKIHQPPLSVGAASVTVPAQPPFDNDTDCEQASTSSFGTDVMLSLSDTPFQPSVSSAIQPQHLGQSNNDMKKCILHIQESWFARNKWLHYVPWLQGVLWFVCAKAEKLKMVDKRDPSFIVNNW